MNNLSVTQALSSKINEACLQKINVKLQINFFPTSCEVVVNDLASMDGPFDVYCWYEGCQCLPMTGALFMKTLSFLRIENS